MSGVGNIHLVTCALLTKIKIIDPARIGEMLEHSPGVTCALLTKIKILIQQE
jgi:hypothetical protein